MFTISWMRGNPSLFLTASLFYTYQPVAVKIYMYLIRSSFSVLEKNRQRKKTYFSKSYVKKNFRIYIYCERARKNIWINFAAYLNKNATVTGQRITFSAVSMSLPSLEISLKIYMCNEQICFIESTDFKKIVSI